MQLVLELVRQQRLQAKLVRSPLKWFCTNSIQSSVKAPTSSSLALMNNSDQTHTHTAGEAAASLLSVLTCHGHSLFLAMLLEINLPLKLQPHLSWALTEARVNEGTATPCTDRGLPAKPRLGPAILWAPAVMDGGSAWTERAMQVWGGRTPPAHSDAAVDFISCWRIW